MFSSSYTEDHLVEQPAIELMEHELGWDVVNCYDEWSGGVSNQGRDGKREGVKILNFECLILNGRGRRPALQRLNPDLPVEAIEGAVEEMRILNVGFWILNGRGRRKSVPCRRRFPDFTKSDCFTIC
jgi:hypothetical protein